MDNQDKATFSLDDEEIVEEEVIDRDEEYEDDDYDDEEYDDEYDDEEGYDDEEYDEDGDYDDGYNDDYYDDRLNKVLDELAELKRGMAPAPVQQMPPSVMPPQYIYQPTAPPAGSEVVMYNEISRLRDELAKNQNSLEMQKELSRIKEDMARDQKFAESQYNAEIQRLQSKIDDLLKNGSGPQGELPAGSESAYIEGTSTNLDINKLLSINEAILRAAKDSDVRFQNEIGHLKKQLDEMPSLKELNGAVSAVKKAANNIGGIDPDTIAKLTAEIDALKSAIGEKGISVSAPAAVPVSVSVKNGDIDASELLRQLYDIKVALGNASEAAVNRAKTLSELIGAYKKVNYDVHSQNVSFKNKLESVCDYVKKLKECGEPDTLDLIDAVNANIAELSGCRLTREIFNDLTAYCNEHGITTLTSAVRDGAEKYFGLVQKITEVKPESYGDYLPDMLAAVNVMEGNRKEAENAAVIGEITSLLLAENTDHVALSEKVHKFATLKVGDIMELPTVEQPKEYSVSANVSDESVFTKLAEIKSALSEISQIVQANDRVRSEQNVRDGAAVQSAAPAVVQAAVLDDASVNRILQSVEELKNKLETAAGVPDVADALEEIRKNYVEISDRIIEVSQKLQAPAQASESVTENTSVATENPRSDNGVSDEEKERMLEDIAYIRGKLDEYDSFINGIPDLRADVINIANSVDISEQFTELRKDIAGLDKFAEIAETLNDIRKDIADLSSSSVTDKIEEIRKEISELNKSSDISEQLSAQTNSLVSEVGTQLDKLYDDLTGVLIESESNLMNRLNESGNNDAIENAKVDIMADTQVIRDTVFGVSDSVLVLNDAVENAKTDIITDTQSIRDSLLVVNDLLLAAPTNDNFEQLRADINAYFDSEAANSEAAAADRQKILEDIAFLREQAELAISESNTEDQIPDGESAIQDNETLINYLDDIAGRVALLNGISEDTAAAKQSVTALNDNVTAIGGSISSVYDSIAALNDGITSVNDNITAFGSTVDAVNDTVAAFNENVASVGENITAVSESISAVGDGVNATRDAAVAALDALAPIDEKLNSILDRLDSAETESEYADENEGNIDQSYAPGIMSDEELIELKDSLNTILDTLPLFPQADDVITARDNTYAILDSLTLMPHADDVVAVRENVASVLEAVGNLSESLSAAVSADISSEVAGLREAVDASSEDIKYIRSKLEETNGVSAEGFDVQSLTEELSLVLDKIEQYELAASANKQEIIDTVNGIREEIHINTLDENMSAAGMDGETRDALLGEIAEIRERLGNIESFTQSNGDTGSAAIDELTAQIADLQVVITDRFSAGISEDAENTAELQSDAVQAVLGELAAIKERLDSVPEYDTVEEILSLRDDIKAARIVDQDEVSSELESIKNELASISSGNILDEIRALREDISNLPVGDGIAEQPTDGEINLVLNEIVSLRDEVFAFKDEVLNATALTTPLSEPDSERSVGNPDDMTALLDELTALRADQSALTENIDDLKDIVSRRTAITADGDNGEQTLQGDLNVVLDEIINLKNDVDRIEESLGGERLNAISEQVDDIRAMIEDLHGIGGTAADGETSEEHGSVYAQEIDLTPIMEQFETVNAALDDLRINRELENGQVSESGSGVISARFDELQGEIEEIKAAVEAIAPVDYATEIAELRNEIETLRAENELLKSGGADGISEQLADLKETIRDMTLAMAPVTSADGDTSYAALIDEIRDLKAQIVNVTENTAPVSAVADENIMAAIRDALAAQTSPQSYAEELGDIRDEIAQLRSLTTVAAESGGMSEAAAIRDEIAEIKAMISSPESLVGVAEDVTAIKADVRTLKDEPDLGVMNEILALRDEFQALREQIEDVKRIAGKTDSEADDSLMNEVQSLRDQLFAISMANVNDPASGESNYESYNNIILDELASLRDQVNSAGSASDLALISDEFAQLKSALDKREALYEALADRVSKIDNDTASNRILDELTSLRADMSNQRDADLTTLNFMSEMAHLLERQNQYLTQNAGSRITDEIESLKAEIASSDAVAEEVAKLREVMSQSGNASDNETILTELADLREELSREKPSRENALILDAISRLRDEITVLAEREKVRDLNSDADLSDSLTDLKEQLNEIAGIMEPTGKTNEPPVQAENKPSSTGAKRGRKPGSKNGTKSGASRSVANRESSATKSTGAKRGRKPGTKNAVNTDKADVNKNEPVNPNPITTVIEPYSSGTFDFDAKIEEQMRRLDSDNDMSLNINKTISTTDAMDVADKLAKQVANKLIMEQLVEQLGDGGVSEERVDEILRDILPQEFTTIAETESSDKVRRLANQLVLNKLRSRLNGKNNSED